MQLGSMVDRRIIMRIYTYETSIEDIKNLYNKDKPIIFLAGPTPRPNQSHIPSWRIKAIEEFKRQNFTGNIIIPEFEKIGVYSKDLPIWEFEGLKVCDVIMFWIPRTIELIGLTTNQEFGYWMARDRKKIVYGRPDDAYRIEYQDIMWKEDSVDRNMQYIPICNALKDTISYSIQRSYFLWTIERE